MTLRNPCLPALPWRPDSFRPQPATPSGLPGMARGGLLRKIPTAYRKESSPGREATRAMRGNHPGSLSYVEGEGRRQADARLEVGARPPAAAGAVQLMRHASLRRGRVARPVLASAAPGLS